MTALEKFVSCIIEEAEKAPPNTSIADLMGSMGWVNKQAEPAAEPLQAAVLESLKAIVEFADAPAEGKRPDVFFMRINNARAAIARAEQAVHGIGEKE